MKRDINGFVSNPVKVLTRVCWACLFLGLAACSDNDGLDDLRAFTDAEKAKKASKIEPLPSVHATEVFKYTASSIVSPFSEENVLPEIKATLEIAPILPDQEAVSAPYQSAL